MKKFFIFSSHPGYKATKEQTFLSESNCHK